MVFDSDTAIILHNYYGIKEQAICATWKWIAG